MYYYINIVLTKNALENVHLKDEFVQNQLHIAGRLTRFPSHTFPQRHSAFPYWSPASIDFNGAALNGFFQRFETRRSLDKRCDYVPPTDAQRLWEWMGSGLARTPSFCVMIGGSASPFDWQRFCTIRNHWSYSRSVPSRISQVQSK